MVTLATSPLPAAQEPTVAESEAVAVVRTFLAALEKGDFTGATDLIAGTKEPNSSLFPFVPAGTRFALRTSRTYGNDAETIVVAEIEFSTPNGSPQKVTDTFRLRKEGETWKILAEPISPRLLPPPSIIAMLLLEPRTTGAPNTAKKIACLSNVKQLSLATMIYLTDHDDRFPDASQWRNAVMPYTKNAKLFRCPADTSDQLSSYRMNPRLSRVESTKVREPANTVMIFEGDQNGFVARHAGTGSVGFADGHARVLSSKLYAGLRQTP
jgi:prepilin-type processing-associated H-X9-DG protein